MMLSMRAEAVAARAEIFAPSRCEESLRRAAVSSSYAVSPQAAASSRIRGRTQQHRRQVLEATGFLGRKLSAQFCGPNVEAVRRCAGLARAEQAGKPSGRIITGKCFVVGDNIDTDQIIPAEYLTLVPSKPDEYEKLGSYAMCGLPSLYGRYIEEGKIKTSYPIMIGGNNFGCGSSREHAPVAMGAAGCKAVVAPSFARIYFRNCVATGELYPVESEIRLCDEFKTGDEVTVDMEHDLVINHSSGKQYPLKPIGEAGPVIDAGGIFNYARSTGMIAAKS